MQVVYLDVLIIENMLMNYVILHISSKASGFASSKIKLVSGAAIGTLYAILSLFIKTFFTALAGKILLSAIMVYVTFFPKNIKDFLKISAFFYAVTFVFAGLSFAALYMGNVSVSGNVLITVCLGYLLINVIMSHVKKRQKAASVAAEVYIQFDGNSDAGVWLQAMVDTGNSLKDPFSGKPVIVAEIGAVEKIIPYEVCDYIKQNTAEYIQGEWGKRLRLVPYKAVGTENGILAGFRADVVRIGGDDDDKNIIELNGIVVCLCTDVLSENEEYKALLAPEMIA